MQKLISAIAAIALTIWLGGQLSIGYLAVPVLFHSLPDKQLAGLLAGTMFNALGYVGIICGVILLLEKRYTATAQQSFWRNKSVWIIAAMLGLGLIIQCGLSPAMSELKLQAQPLDIMHSSFAAPFKMLHGVSSILYLLESVLGVVLLLRNTLQKF
ncbi:MAG: DUF4149 domain-containing protein [Gallionella sp.]